MTNNVIPSFIVELSERREGLKEIDHIVVINTAIA
jgi:hypothetical protein